MGPEETRAEESVALNEPDEEGPKKSVFIGFWKLTPAILLAMAAATGVVWYMKPLGPYGHAKVKREWDGTEPRPEEGPAVMEAFSLRNWLTGSSSDHSPATGAVPGALAKCSDCVKFLAVGDFGCTEYSMKYQPWSQVEVAKGMETVASAVKPVFIAGVGDVIYDFGARSYGEIEKNWQEPFISKPSLKVPWHIILGNHDWRSNPDTFEGRFDSSGHSRGYWVFPHFWYKKSYRGNGVSVDLFYVDTMIWLWAAHDSRHMMQRSGGDFHHPRQIPMNEPYYSQQVDWLAHALRKSTADWKVVLGHHPMYTTGAHGSNVDHGYFHGKTMASLDDIMRNGGVSIYINGHNHNQEVFQFRGVTYVTTGNGCKAYKSGGQCERQFRLPSGTRHSDSKFFDCDGGFVGLSFSSSSGAELVMFDKSGGEMVSFQLSNNPQLPDRRLTLLRKPMGSCYGTSLTLVDRECPQNPCVGQECCMALPELTAGESCSMYCSWHGLQCREGFFNKGGGRDECEISSKTPAGCDQKNNVSDVGLICHCGPR